MNKLFEAIDSLDTFILTEDELVEADYYYHNDDEPYISITVATPGEDYDEVQCIIPFIWDGKSYKASSEDVNFIGPEGDEVYPNNVDIDKIIKGIPKSILNQIKELKKEDEPENGDPEDPYEILRNDFNNPRDPIYKKPLDGVKGESVRLLYYAKDRQSEGPSNEKTFNNVEEAINYAKDTWDPEKYWRIDYEITYNNNEKGGNHYFLKA